MSKCVDTLNYGNPCLPYKIFGQFADKEVKVVCAYCLRFLGWGAVEKSYETREQRASIIAQLLAGELSDWERGFLNSIRAQDNLSEKQAACFKKIRDKYLTVIESKKLTVAENYLDDLF